MDRLRSPSSSKMPARSARWVSVQWVGRVATVGGEVMARGAGRGRGDLRAGPRGRGAGARRAVGAEWAADGAGRGADGAGGRAGGAHRAAGAQDQALVAQLLAAAQPGSAGHAAAA